MNDFRFGCVGVHMGKSTRVESPQALMSFYYKSTRNLGLLLIVAVTAKTSLADTRV